MGGHSPDNRITKLPNTQLPKFASGLLTADRLFKLDSLSVSAWLPDSAWLLDTEPLRNSAPVRISVGVRCANGFVRRRGGAPNTTVAYYAPVPRQKLPWVPWVAL